MSYIKTEHNVGFDQHTWTSKSSRGINCGLLKHFGKSHIKRHLMEKICIPFCLCSQRASDRAAHSYVKHDT